MPKITFVFSGQGDQFPGMGKALYETSPAARAVFDACDALRPGTSTQCFQGTAEELQETKNTQPCLFSMELSAANMLREKGVVPCAVAGFSLGEVTAATFAGYFTNEDGFRLVCRRGEVMQSAAEQFDTAMAAVVKLSNEQVEEICSHYEKLYPVNFNCPGQVTVSGLKSVMADFTAEVKAAGGRAIPLKVKGAFHSPFMQTASEEFGKAVAASAIHCPDITLYSNVTAKPYGEDAASLLTRQIASPVRWEQLVRTMIADGIDTFIEIGPGKTLTNMIKKIDPSVQAYTYTEYLEAMAE